MTRPAIIGELVRVDVGEVLEGDEACDNRGNEAGRSSRAAAHAKCKRQGQCHCRNRQPGHEILHAVGAAVVSKFRF